MDNPTHTVPAVPEPAPPGGRAHDRPYDPSAVALGNASLLGVGYLMMGRRKLAVAAGVVTVALVWLIVSAARPWCESVALVWWAAVIAHGWFLAGGRTRRRVMRGQRLAALGVTVPVLLAVGLLRFDASRIGQSVTEARENGDCAQVLTAQDRVWLGHRVADASLTARGDEVVEDCHRLETAKSRLETGLTGDTAALREGFGTLAAVLEKPGNDKTVGTVLTGFLDGLATEYPCGTVRATDWLRDREPSHNTLDRSADAATRAAPAALVGCGDDLMEDDDWKTARARYEQLLDQYPDDTHVAQAREGVKRATQAIELANVRSLLAGAIGSQPEYCSKPAKYSGAKPIGKGANRALFYGSDEYTDKLPATWQAKDAADAVLVVCAGDTSFGASVRTCPYEGGTSGITNVTFHKVEIPVKVYELRTGKLVDSRKVQISGSSCPSLISYTTYGYNDWGPPSDQYVDPSETDARAAFRPLVNR